MTSPSQSALLIIDVQNGMFSSPENQPHDGDALIQTINELIGKARDAECPIVFVQHDGVGDHPLIPGSKEHEILNALNREPQDPVVRKTQCGSFNGTNLLDVLHKQRIGHLVVCGLQTEYCVDTAIRSACDHGFKVTVAEKAHSTFNSESISAADIIEHHQTIWATAFGATKSVVDIDFARSTHV